MSYSPILLFTFNRPEQTKRVIDALRNNRLAHECELYVFSDGPRNSNDILLINEVRKCLKTIDGFKKVTLIERQENYGLAKSIISGVTQIINSHEKVIVLEDDLVTSKYFLEYMNDALDLYEKNDRVISIHGYIYPIDKELPETFFLRGADCWGWATWKRGWDLFEENGEILLTGLIKNNLEKEFNFNNSYDYVQMLKDQIQGKNNSWAIRWYASAYIKNKLTLYPGHSLVQNIGFDGLGTHCGKTNDYDTVLSETSINVNMINVTEDVKARKLIEKYFRTVDYKGRFRIAYYKYFVKIWKKIANQLSMDY